MLGLAILVALAARRLRLPYTVGLVLAGAALAVTRSHAGLALTHDLIFDVVLPPLLFEAALNLRWSDLKRDLVPVVALSTIGVVLCALVVAGGLVAWLGWPLESALVFGALIGATDPIAVIALLRESRVTGPPAACSSKPRACSTTAPPRSCSRSSSSGRPMIRETRKGPLSALTTFAVVAGGGLAAGFGVGLIAVMIAGTSDDHLVETALTVVAAFGSFLIAEHFGASGVLATVAAGMTMGNLGVLTPKERFGLSLTPHGRAFVLEFWEFAAFLANSLVFLLIGSALATVDFAREGLLRARAGDRARARWAARSRSIRSASPSRARAGRSRSISSTSCGGAACAARWRWRSRCRCPTTCRMRDDILISAFAVVAFSVIVQGLTAPLALRALGVVRAKSTKAGRTGF